MIGKLLEHTQAATTERYAHLAADPVRAANEAIGERIAAVMKGDTNGAEVLTLGRVGRRSSQAASTSASEAGLSETFFADFGSISSDPPVQNSSKISPSTSSASSLDNL